jgi:hypothetical protein
VFSPLQDDDSTTVMLKGVPPNMSERDVFDFFSDIGLSPINVRMLTDPHGSRTGQVICEFQDPGQARRATTKDGMVFGRNTISVNLLARKGGALPNRTRPGILGSAPPGPGFVPNPRFHNPVSVQDENPFVQALNAQPPRMMLGPGGPHGGLRGRGGPRMRGRGGPGLGPRPSRFTPAEPTTDFSHGGEPAQMGFFERPGKYAFRL